MKLFVGAALITAAIASGSQAATITNGSFEDPGTVSGNWATYGVGSTALTGWDIESGSIDLINAFWEHSDGFYSINLDGGAPGTISQVITGLTVGQSYRLMFDMAANTADPNTVVGLTASVGRDSQSFTFDSTGYSRSNMGWETYMFHFVAGTEDMTLRFASDSPSGPYGPALDNITVSAVPLPAAGLMLLAGLGGLAAMRRRTR